LQIPTKKFVNHNSPGFHSAIANAIANHATVTTADPTSVAALPANISQLTIELLEANAKLLKMAKHRNHGNNEPPAGAPGSRHKLAAGPHYCHMHSSQVWHSSPQCCWKGPDHKDATTEANKLGGSTKTFSK
jgi:hypothetical protein